MTTQQPETVSVNKAALLQVLQALTGPGHLIRELQATRSIEALTGATNPINELIRNYTAATEA